MEPDSASACAARRGNIYKYRNSNVFLFSRNHDPVTRDNLFSQTTLCRRARGNMCLLMDEGFVLLAVWDVNMNGVLLGRNVGSDVCKCIVMGKEKRSYIELLATQCGLSRVTGS